MERGSGHNDKLDLWKCVAIYSVIFIHILLPGQIGVAVNCLARFAVPLFFLSAGVFSWRSPPRVLARRTVRTAGLLLFACLALLSLGCAMARHGGASMGAYLLGRFTWANAASLVLWQLFPLPYSWPLWFLAALLMIYLMWWGLTALLRGRLPHRLLAVLALCVAGAAAAADGTPAAGTPFQIFSRGVAGFFEMFGVPVSIATVFMTMCVSALALTSLDAVARIGRMSFQELFSVDDMEHAEGWRKLFCNVYFSTFVTLAFGFLLTQIGYANIWPLFGSANQLLSALVLATLCVFLKVTGRNNKMLFPPLVIMLCVTFTALVQRLIAMVKAISAAAATAIPAGETTWGAVFIANGLQLILAILLIVLGLNIVFHSVKGYKASEKNSEKAAV